MTTVLAEARSTAASSTLVEYRARTTSTPTPDGTFLVEIVAATVTVDQHDCSVDEQVVHQRTLAVMCDDWTVGHADVLLEHVARYRRCEPWDIRDAAGGSWTAWTQVLPPLAARPVDHSTSQVWIHRAWFETPSRKMRRSVASMTAADKLARSSVAGQRDTSLTTNGAGS